MYPTEPDYCDPGHLRSAEDIDRFMEPANRWGSYFPQSQTGDSDMGEMVGPPDLSAVGNAASGSKSALGDGAKTLTDFSVKKGDDGGVVVCENRGAEPPAGRRSGASYPKKTDYKENPFAADDLESAATFAAGLFVELSGMEPPAPPPPPEAPAEMPPPPPAGMVAPPPPDQGF